MSTLGIVALSLLSGAIILAFLGSIITFIYLLIHSRKLLQECQASISNSRVLVEAALSKLSEDSSELIEKHRLDIAALMTENQLHLGNYVSKVESALSRTETNTQLNLEKLSITITNTLAKIDGEELLKASRSMSDSARRNEKSCLAFAELIRSVNEPAMIQTDLAPEEFAQAEVGESFVSKVKVMVEGSEDGL